MSETGPLFPTKAPPRRGRESEKNAGPLLDAGAAVGAHLPVRVERAVAGGADVADLRVADRADNEVAVDGGAALGADAVVAELVLAQGDVEVLLLAVDEVGARAQDDVGEQAHDGDDRDDGPHPPGLRAAALGVADDVDDGEDVEHDDAHDHEVEDHADLGGDELVEQFLRHVRDSFDHVSAPFGATYSRDCSRWRANFGRGLLEAALCN